MYSGTTLHNNSGRIVGVHQKIDRVARKNLKRHIPSVVHFPNIKTILHFEGVNGPDGIKRKSPGVDEPWHFIDPKDPNDRRILDDIDNHIYNLSNALSANDEIKAGFEAAWLAHAVVDGLTPPHHYPIEEKIEELWGKPHQDRGSLKEKNLIKGVDGLDTISKNWEYWGAKGVMMTHFNFEFGAASAIAADKFKKFSISSSDLEQVKSRGFESIYLEAVHFIDSRNMYNRLYKNGWTESLAQEVRSVLIPQMIRAVALAWYQSILNSIKED